MPIPGHPIQSSQVLRHAIVDCARQSYNRRGEDTSKPAFRRVYRSRDGRDLRLIPRPQTDFPGARVGALSKPALDKSAEPIDSRITPRRGHSEKEPCAMLTISFSLLPQLP